MDTRNFYDLWQSTDQGFPIEQFGAIPEFCRAHMADGEPAVMRYLDGWDVEPTGDSDADLETGRLYAEMAVAYARSQCSPAFIAFVLDAITLKAVLNGCAFCVVEIGFFQRIAQISYCGSMN